MDYAQEFLYLEYIMNERTNNAYLEGAINESLLMVERNNTIENMNVINEGVSDKIKAMIAKVIGAISRIWGKFLEVVNHLTTRDKTYLEKYKKIILEKGPLQAYKYKMYDYRIGQKRVIETPIPAFNIQSLSKDLVDKDTFMKKWFKNMVVNYTEDYKIPEKAKEYFRGTEEPIKIEHNDLNMTDLYNYCITYGSIKNKIEADIKNIKAAANEVLKNAEQIKREKTTTSEQTLINNRNIFEPGTYCSYLYEGCVLNEVEIINDDKDKPEEKQSSNQSSNSTVKTTTNPNDAYKGQSNTKKEDDKENLEHVKDKSTDLDDTIKKIQLYITITGEILSAKLSVAEEIYKAYMTIIRAHVKDHVGRKGNDYDKSKDKATVQGTVDNGENDKAAKDAVNSL